MLKISNWKNPLLLLLGIGVSNLGAWVYLIALNLIVLDMTGSPFAVSILYILIPVSALCTNFWSGSLIDRVNKRKLMILLDLLRAFFIFLLPFMDSLLFIYLCVLLINMASSIFGPTSMVYMTKLIPKTNRQRFNALRNFINSSGFILGPSIAGFLFIIGSPYLAIQLNSLALCMSAAIILVLPNLDNVKSAAGNPEKMSLRVIRNDWIEVLRFSKSNRHIAWVYVLFSGITVFMTGLDSLEAAFATRVLLLSDSTYGFLVSVAGIGIIIGSLTNALASRLQTNFLISFGAVFTPFGYLIFAFSQNFIWASIGFFTLTFALSFANIGFLTFYQNNVPITIMGRFSSVFGIVEALLIISFTAAIGILAEVYGIRSVYIIGSFIFFAVGFLVSVTVLDKTKSVYY
ncbi:MFS transporter [Sporosarcina sp.]|uniref:MFS transporter n=1 Tax=Sporosarcina sp. TaxID=49982 RepID=UPI00260BC087|nr:MFS transporter [Sporosarcina sp.]